LAGTCVDTRTTMTDIAWKLTQPGVPSGRRRKAVRKSDWRRKEHVLTGH
jgi:hypothetical protein